MQPVVQKLTAKEWAAMSEGAHLICFNEQRPSSMDRIDFALIVVRDQELLSYCTVRELDSESCYWQYGGAFPNAKGGPESVYSYRRYLDWCFLSGYKRVTTYIENTNLPMLKIALKTGFLIIGTRTFKNKIYLELLNEKGE